MKKKNIEILHFRENFEEELLCHALSIQQML